MNFRDGFLNISTILMEDVVVLTLSGDVHETDYQKLINLTIGFVTRNNAYGVLIAMSDLNFIDRQVLDQLLKLTKLLKIMGLKVGWVGLRPSIIASFMDIYEGQFDTGIAYSQSLDEGIKKIKI